MNIALAVVAVVALLVAVAVAAIAGYERGRREERARHTRALEILEERTDPAAKMASKAAGERRIEDLIDTYDEGGRGP